MTEKGECGDGKGNPHPNHILSYSETSPKERGNVATEKGKLGNERISKLERDSGRAVGKGRGGGLI